MLQQTCSDRIRYQNMPLKLRILQGSLKLISCCQDPQEIAGKSRYKLSVNEKAQLSAKVEKYNVKAVMAILHCSSDAKSSNSQIVDGDELHDSFRTTILDESSSILGCTSTP